MTLDLIKTSQITPPKAQSTTREIEHLDFIKMTKLLRE